MDRREPLHYRQGLWVAVLGPDGAGKSAAIQQLMEDLSSHFGEIQRFHFRPMFKRRERHSSPVTDPHGKLPRSLPVSILKLLYWFVDYWFGYLTVIHPALLSSTLIMFDRYYDDLLVDPKRYRLPVSSLHFAKLLARLVPRPDLYIVLDVPAELVQRRKAEVSCAESRRQRIAYLQMFHSLPNAFIIDAAEPLDNVTRQMRSVILHTLTNRAQHRTGVSLIARA